MQKNIILQLWAGCHDLKHYYYFLCAQYNYLNVILIFVLQNKISGLIIAS